MKISDLEVGMSLRLVLGWGSIIQYDQKLSPRSTYTVKQIKSGCFSVNELDCPDNWTTLSPSGFVQVASASPKAEVYTVVVPLSPKGVDSIYVAGGMTGLPEGNFPAFHKATATLRDKGWFVYNPAERDEEQGFDPKGVVYEPGMTSVQFLRDALAWDMVAVCQCEAIYMLKGWERSFGARAEHALTVAIGNGMKIIYEGDE